MAVDVQPISGAPFGTRVTGLDPRAIGDAERDAIRVAHDEGKGLVHFAFDNLLEPDELHALTALFGESELAPGLVTGYGKGDDGSGESVADQIARLRTEGIDPYLTHLGNADATTLEARPVPDKFFGEWEWHTDMSYIPTPPTFSVLHGRTIPSTGGDTCFASQVLAAASLPPQLRATVAGRHIKHDSTYTSAGILRPGMAEPASPIDAIGATHPILRRIPDTGHEALFLGRRTNAYVVGLDLDDSEALLDALWAHATSDELVLRHRWRAGDTVVWDNRMLLHRRDPFPADEIRFMWRTQTKGEAVVAA